MRRAAMVAAGATLLAGVSAVALSSGASHRVPLNRPPGSITGALNPQVTQTNLASTICKKGWTTTIRPPLSYTENLKRQQLRAFKLPGKLGDYEEDHFIPLELAGSPQDPKNLWPESHPRSFTMDGEENALHRAVCSNAMPLAAAQAKIAADKRAGG